MPLPDGSIRWVESCGEPRLASGKQVISGLLQDITERKRAEIALRESEERLRFALEAANAGTWESVPETGEFISSDRALALHGAPPGTPMSHEKALVTVHPGDRPRVAEAVRCALATGEPYRAEFRMPLPDGSIRWVESRGEPRFVSGRQILCGLLQDITDQKRAEIALRESEELLRAIIEHVPVPILLSREDRKILLINPALTKLTGYTLADIPTRDEWEACAYRENAQHVRMMCTRFLNAAYLPIAVSFVFTPSPVKNDFGRSRQRPPGKTIQAHAFSSALLSTSPSAGEVRRKRGRAPRNSKPRSQP